MKENIQGLTQALKEEASALLEKHFGNTVKIGSIISLREEPDRRNNVFRIILKNNDHSVPSSVILKQSLPEPSDSDDKDAYARFSRDWAGLAFLNSLPGIAHTIPKLYAGSKAQRFVIIEDLGNEHISLVDALTIPDKDKAISALDRFVKSLGKFHAASFGKIPHYGTFLFKINEHANTLSEDLIFNLEDLISNLKLANQRLALPVRDNILIEATEIIKAIIEPGDFTVLTHGDICPDNVFDHDNEMQLIDFEWISPRNALLDGTYLRMSMPTCWCAKAIPDDIIEASETIYRDELKARIPAASDEQAYHRAYTQACGFWLLRTMCALNSTLEKDELWPSDKIPEKSLWKADENWVRPRVFSRLHSFVLVANKHDMFPHLREMTIRILSALESRWPKTSSLDFYPAFKI